MIHHKITNDSVQVEALEWKGQYPTLTPAFFIPGMFGTAESFRSEIESNWQDRTCISVSLRGRGGSSAPKAGYSLADHASDVQAVVNALCPNGAIFVAHSTGAAYALAFAQSHPDLVKGIALLDHPPFHFPIEETWVEQSRSEPSAPAPSVLQALQKEADFADLRGALKSLSSPVFLVAGREGDSMLTKDDLIAFSAGLTNPTIYVEKDSGHDLRTLEIRKLLEPIL